MNFCTMINIYRHCTSVLFVMGFMHVSTAKDTMVLSRVLTFAMILPWHFSKYFGVLCKYHDT